MTVRSRPHYQRTEPVGCSAATAEDQWTGLRMDRVAQQVSAGGSCLINPAGAVVTHTIKKGETLPLLCVQEPERRMRKKEQAGASPGHEIEQAGCFKTSRKILADPALMTVTKV